MAVSVAAMYEQSSVRMDSAQGFNPRFLRMTPRFSKATLNNDSVAIHSMDERSAMPEAIDGPEFFAMCPTGRGNSSCSGGKLPKMYLIDLANFTIDGVASSGQEAAMPEVSAPLKSSAAQFAAQQASMGTPRCTVPSIDLASLAYDSFASDSDVGTLGGSTSSPTCSELLESAVLKSSSLIQELKDLSGELDIDLDRTATESTASEVSFLADSSPRPGRDDFASFVLGKAESLSSLVSTGSPCSDACSSPRI